MPPTPPRSPVRITLERTRGFRWAAAQRGDLRAHAVGFAADGGRSLDSAALAERFAALGGAPDELAAAAVKLLGELPGGYAVVIESPDAVVALSDRIRSFPLYYGVAGAELVLADDADVVRRRVGPAELDDDAITEYLLAGYVTGPDTLVRGVSQIEQGQCLTWTWHRPAAGVPGVPRVPRVPGGEPTIRLHAQRHFRFVPNRSVDADADDQAVEGALADSLDAAFERFMVTVRGRRVIVPLSGGCDSRVVACMLARHGVKDVLCYSYGRPGDLEVVRSAAVAGALGLRWVFAPYSRRACRRANRPSHLGPLIGYCTGLASAPHLQDWAALAALSAAGELRGGDVVVPGHTDAVSGSHVPQRFTEPGSFTRDHVIDRVLLDHYNLWDWRNAAPRIGPMLRRRIDDRLPPIPVHTGAHAAAALDAWDIQERQCKYICHSVRSYEWLGLEWRMPLTDPDWMAVVAAVPMRLRFKRRAYWAMLDRRLFQPRGVGIDAIAALDGGMRRTLIDRLVRRAQLLLPGDDRLVAHRFWQPNFARLSSIDLVRLLIDYSRRFDGPGDLPAHVFRLSVAMSTWLGYADARRRVGSAAS